MENIMLSFVLLKPFTCIISFDHHLSPIKYMAYYFKHLKKEGKKSVSIQRLLTLLK